jgi:hypothetical protein
MWVFETGLKLTSIPPTQWLPLQRTEVDEIEVV